MDRVEIIKKIEELKERIKPLHCFGVERVIKNNLEVWIQYYEKKLKECEV